MFNKNYIKQLSAAALALLVSATADSAPGTPTALIAFPAVTLTDKGGVPLNQAILTAQGQGYEVTVIGLGVGGTKGANVTVTGEVYGLTNLNDLEGPFLTEPANASPTEVSSDDLWLYGESGVSICLHTGNPAITLASGSDTVLLQFAPTP